MGAASLQNHPPFMINRSTSFRPLYVLAMMAAMAVAGFLPCLPVSAGESNDTGSGVRERIIAVDVEQVQGPLDTSFKECVGAGRANEGLRADWQDQLRAARRECGFQYIRMHGLLTDDMGVYREDARGHPVYNWQYVDRLYDFLLSIDIWMKPANAERSLIPIPIRSLAGWWANAG